MAATVRALRLLPGLAEVVVVDDGSRDGTAREASRAGARVLRAPRNLGKGRALEGALHRLPPAQVYLFADADLGPSASSLEPLLALVVDGAADLAVAVLPPPPSGGFGLVKRFARGIIGRLSGFRPAEPLSGQRALTSDVLSACRPLSSGFGVEVGMTADAVRMGFRVVEVPLLLEHRFTRRDLRGFLHRGKQGLDALRAAAPRLLRLR